MSSRSASAPLRVLHVLRPAVGGMRRHVELLSAELAARGVHLAAAVSAGFALELPEGAPVFPIPLTARPHPLHDLRAAALTARHARAFGLIHAHGLRGAWVGALAARLARRPLVFTAHNLAPSDPALPARLLFRAAARRAAAVIAVSQAVAESLSGYGVDAARIRIIPNGIDLAPFNRLPDRASLREKWGLAPDAPVVAAAGRLAPEKGFRTLIEAAPRLMSRCPGARVLLAGSGPEAEALQARARAIAPGESCRFLGQRSDLPEILAMADAVAIPSLAEGQGLVALEAMAARRPVAASRVGGLRETVVDGETGLLITPGDPDALADALATLLEDAEMRARMGAAGRARVEAFYTADRMAQETLELYQSV